MKIELVITLAVILLATFVGIAFAGQPMGIVGVRLGDYIGQHKALVLQDTAQTHWDLPYLGFVEIVPPEGYRSGYLVYGRCKEPGRIVRIKLKMEDESRKFFDQLLEAYKKQFGKPDVYKGDAFGAFIAWKWDFKDEHGNTSSMILQYYHGEDEEHPGGTTLKLTASSLQQVEHECWESRYPSGEAIDVEGRQRMGRTESGIEWFVPKR